MDGTPDTAPVASLKSAALADRLVTAIAVGAYSPGEPLPAERDLAMSFGVSRTTVRLALQHVAQLGLIESRRGRGGGNFVASVSWEDVAPGVARRTLETEIPQLLELYDYRCLVEGMIAGTAAQRRSDADIQAIEDALASFQCAENMIGARAADRRLHGVICSAAHNAHLTSLSAQLTARATLGFGAEPYTVEFLAEATRHHEELVRHVIDGNSHAAAECAQHHFALTLETMRASLKRATSTAPGS